MRLYILLILALFITGLPAQDDEVYAGLKRKASKSSKGTKAGKKKSTEIDLEALDIQGLIDRPQTLYILKKSKIDFYDTIDENDYVKSIVESTYKAPF
jgi:hypothetical protein